MMFARDLARLFRVRVCLFAGLAAFSGYALCRPLWETGMFLTVGACLLLAAGCSALNQAQERRQDALMRRTATRPLPAGRMSLAQALLLALGCIASAFALFMSLGGAALALACLSVLLYNGLYTPLKRRSAYALLVGGAAGALPPALGWVAAGGELLDFRILSVCLVVYLWQAPHFWLLAARHQDDYRAAGFPVLECFPTSNKPGARLPSLSPATVWLLGLGCSMLLLPVFGVVSPATGLLFLLLALGLASSVKFLFTNYSFDFMLVNISMLLFMSGVAIDALWRIPGF